MRAGEHHRGHIVDEEGGDLCIGGGGPAVLCEAQHLGQIGDGLLVVGVREILLALVALLDKVGVALQHIVGVAQVIQEADVPDIAAADNQRGHIALVLDGLAEGDELVPGLGDLEAVVGKVLLVVHNAHRVSAGEGGGVGHAVKINGGGEQRLDIIA